MKNPPCQTARRVSRKLYQLFSSFLRGASCPKSPRVAATAAVSFMPESLVDVKSAICNPNAVRGLIVAGRGAAFLRFAQVKAAPLCAIKRTHCVFWDSPQFAAEF